MQKTVLITAFIFLLVTETSFSQKTELGFGIGGTNYIGDLSPGYKPEFTRPGANFFLRLNTLKGWTWRFNLLIANLYADESKFNRPLPSERGLTFSNTFSELGAIAEYNFFNYRDNSKLINFSPYLFAGLAVNAAVTTEFEGNESTLPTIFTIPFGVGMKYIIAKQWNMGFEFGARKTFTDDLDGVNDDQNLNSSYVDDWYYYTGINFSYTIYKIPCPFD